MIDYFHSWALTCVWQTNREVKLILIIHDNDYLNQVKSQDKHFRFANAAEVLTGETKLRAERRNLCQIVYRVGVAQTKEEKMVMCVCSNVCESEIDIKLFAFLSQRELIRAPALTFHKHFSLSFSQLSRHLLSYLNTNLKWKKNWKRKVNNTSTLLCFLVLQFEKILSFN